MSKVNHPIHYNTGTLECIEAIRLIMTREQFTGFCYGNVIKYLWRMGHKDDPKQDLEKATWYANAIDYPIHLAPVVWKVCHQSGTELFTTAEASVAANRAAQGWKLIPDLAPEDTAAAQLEALCFTGLKYHN